MCNEDLISCNGTFFGARQVLLPTYEGVAVVQVSAVDPDEEVNATLLFDLASAGDGDASKFRVDRRTGLITVADADGLASHYTLQVAIVDLCLIK